MTFFLCNTQPWSSHRNIETRTLRNEIVVSIAKLTYLPIAIAKFKEKTLIKSMKDSCKIIIWI